MVADLDGARRHAVGRLRRDLPAGLHYHDLRHTRDVAAAAARIAGAEGVIDADLLDLLTAAWFHDLGYIEIRDGHEAAGARMATEVLPGLGYAPKQVARVRALILSTDPRHPPQDHLAMILADADLDSLGRSDFATTSRRLRRELEGQGQHFSDREWWRRQADFLRHHRYFTPAAQALRAAGLAQNLADLTVRLARLDATRP